MAPNLTTEVANTAHEKWLSNEFQDMTSMPGFNNGDFHFWKGTVYDIFRLPKPKTLRPSKDVGIRHANNSMPSLVVLSCLEADYTKTYHEMTLWMANGQGKVQAAILFCYTVSMKPDTKRSYVADEGDTLASLRCVVRIFEYDEGVKNCCRQTIVAGLTPSQLEDVCDDDFPPVVVTLQQLRGGLPPQGSEDDADLDYDFSLMNLWTLAYGIFDQDIEEHEIDLQEYLESPPMSAVLEKGTYDFFGVPSPPASDADDESGTEKGEEEEGPGEEGDHSDFPSSGYSEQGAGETEEDKGEEEGEEEEEEQPEEDDDETEVDEPLRRHPSSGTGLRIAMVPFPIYRTHTPPSAASRGKQTSSSRSARRVREKQQATCLKSPDMPSIRGGTTRIRKDSSSNSVSQAIKVLQPQSSPSSPEYRFPTTCGSVAFPVPGPPEDPAAPPHDANCPYCTTSLRVVGVYELFGFTVHISRPAGENACSDSRMESRKRNLIERVGRVMRELEEEEEAMNDKEDAAQGPPVDDTGIGSDDKVSNSQIDGRITRPISVSGRGEAPRREPISEGGQPRGGKESEIDGGGNKRLPSEAELSPGSGKRSNDLSPIITVPPGPKPPRSKKEVTTPPTEPPKQRPGPDAETRTGKDIDIGKPDRQKRPAGPCTSPGPGSPDIPAAAGKPAIQIDRNDITPDTDTGSTPEIRPPESPNPSLVGGSRSRPPRSRTRGTPTRRPLDPSKGKMISGSAGVHNNPTGVDVAPQKKLDVPHRRTSIASTPLDLSSRKPPLPQVIQPPAGTKEESVAAIPESHDALLAQLQTLLLKLHKGSGGVTMLPNLQLQVACEEAELERLEMEMTLVVKVRGTKDMIHMDGGGCETTRELLGFSGGCAMKR